MMSLKKILICAFLMFGTTAFAQNNAAVEIKGILNSKRNEVKLFKVTNGRTAEIANVNVNKSKQFGFLFYPDYEGLYVIGTGNELNPAQNYMFYFKPGDQLEVALSDTSYTLVKSNSKENQVLKQWWDLSSPLYQKAINFSRSRSTFVDYFPQQEAVVAKSRTFLASKETKNARFDKAMKDIIAMDLASYASNFLNTPRSAHPDVTEYSNFYTTLKALDMTKNAQLVYNYPWGQRVLGAVIMINMRQDKKKFEAGLDGLQSSVNYIVNDTLKGDFVLDFASRYKTLDDYSAAIDRFGKYVLTTDQKLRSSNIMAPLLTYKAGSDAFQFTYKDKEDKDVSFASLKGKVVLIDVWATWCGPCKAEIPFLKKLEEEMKGTDVQVVSISVDEAKDKEKWQKMIKDEQLGGLQLFASGWGELAKYYKITGIPRFMVFDRNGKIVTVDSPRPSSPELKKLLEKTLAK